VDDWGRPKPAGSDEQLLTAAGNGKHCTSSIGILIKVLDESSGDLIHVKEAGHRCVPSGVPTARLKRTYDRAELAMLPGVQLP